MYFRLPCISGCSPGLTVFLTALYFWVLSRIDCFLDCISDCRVYLHFAFSTPPPSDAQRVYSSCKTMFSHLESGLPRKKGENSLSISEGHHISIIHTPWGYVCHPKCRFPWIVDKGLRLKAFCSISIKMLLKMFSSFPPTIFVCRWRSSPTSSSSYLKSLLFIDADEQRLQAGPLVWFEDN